jgi:aspartyl-tRNA(Asn)/glutamyl-tRNA(Gln) amidotransferase subunit C
MALTAETVTYVARLARLTLNDGEVALFTRQLNDILKYVEKLQELNTTGVHPMAHVLELNNVLRADEIHPSLPVDESLQNAPQKEQSAFAVPRVI